MDRTRVVAVLLVFMGWVLAPRATAQPAPSPHDPVRAFLSAFEEHGDCQLDALARSLPRDTGPICELRGARLRTFHNTHLASASRARASEIQFVRFFADHTLRLRVGRDAARQRVRFEPRLDRVLGEPMFNDGRDLALVHAVVSIELESIWFEDRGDPRRDSPRDDARTGRIRDWLASMLTRPMDERPNYYAHARSPGVVEALYLVVREGTVWRLVLHEPVMRRMQERYAAPRPASLPAPPGPYPTLGQTGIPGEPLVLYLMSIFRPGLTARNNDDLARDFYQRYLSSHTRGQIPEADFVAHWRGKARRQWLEPFGGERSVLAFDLDYTVEPPVFNATRDQATIRAAIVTRAGPMLSVRSRTDVVTFRVVREAGTWRVELPDSVVDEIHPPRPPHVLARWFPNVVASGEGITVRVRQVAVERDVTTLVVRIENGTGREASLFMALASATLTDEQGQTFRTRMLRTTVPDRIPGRSSAEGTIAFEPIATTSKRLVLTIPGIGLEERDVTLRVDFSLQRL
jgi:hypothetical protein